MSTICFYFQVHQPYRIKKYRVFDIGNDNQYFDNHTEDNTNNAKILRKVISKCYLPANTLLLKILNEHPDFRISFSLSGVFLEQLIQYTPEVLESFKDLVKTGKCEILGETYYHSLAAVYSKEEFLEQVRLHMHLIKKIFGVTPKVFRNTELIYSNEIAKFAEEMGFDGIISEGEDKSLRGRSPNQLYAPSGCKKIVALLKNYRLSDDIAFRFSDSNWQEFPLTAYKFVDWVSKIKQSENTIKNPIFNLFMDYETFGEHQWEESGIFNFLEHLPRVFLSNKDNQFCTPSEIIANQVSKKASTYSNKVSSEPVSLGIKKSNPCNAKTNIKTNIKIIGSKIQIFIPDSTLNLKTQDNNLTVSKTKEFQVSKFEFENIDLPVLDVPKYISWADTERDLSAWRSNQMQHEALDKIYSFEQSVKQFGDQKLIDDWRKLTTSDHFYYMCTKYWNDGDVHKYFSPYESPYEAFIYYMNVLKDLEIRVNSLESKTS